MMSESLFVYRSRDRHDLFNCGAFSETASSGSQSFHRQSFHFTLGAVLEFSGIKRSDTLILKLFGGHHPLGGAGRAWPRAAFSAVLRVLARDWHPWTLTNVVGFGGTIRPLWLPLAW